MITWKITLTGGAVEHFTASRVRVSNGVLSAFKVRKGRLGYERETTLKMWAPGAWAAVEPDFDGLAALAHDA